MNNVNKKEIINIDLPCVEYVQYTRDCPFNDEILSGEKKGRLIKDYKVIINGEHRADLWSHHHRRGYYLHSLNSSERIRHKEYPYNYEVITKDGFDGIVNKALLAGHILTLAGYEQQKKDHAELLIKLREEVIAERRASQLSDRAEEVIANLNRLVRAAIEEKANGNMPLIKSVSSFIDEISKVNISEDNMKHFIDQKLRNLN